MTNFTSNTYILKRKILSFSNQVSKHLPKKINVVDRLSRHLKKGTPSCATASYLHETKKWAPKYPVLHIDDNNVVKEKVFFCYF